MARKSTRRPITNFLVSSGNQALANTTLGVDQPINDTATGAVQIANGALGVFSNTNLSTRKNHTTLTAGDTLVQAPEIFIAQGTADSANPGQSVNIFPLFPRPWEQSSILSGEVQFEAVKSVYEAPTSAVVVVGETGAIVPQNNTQYQLTISYRGQIIDVDYNAETVAAYTPSYITPNYTVLGTAQPLDDLIQNLTSEINRNSKAIGRARTLYRGNEPVVALALDLTGTDGTDVTAAAVGSILPIINNGVLGTQGITLTQELIDTLTAALPAGSTVLTIDTTTAGTVTNGVAGAFAILALDRDPAFLDDMISKKINIHVGLRRGFDFNAVSNVKTSVPFEGVGVGANLDKWYQKTQRQRKYDLEHRDIPVPTFPSPFDTTAQYTVYSLGSGYTTKIDAVEGGVEYTPRLDVICIPQGDATTIAQFEAIMNPWLQSVGSGTGFVSF